MASERKRTSATKSSKATVARTRLAKDLVKDLRTGIEDLQAIDPEHPWAKLLKEAVAAIREQSSAAIRTNDNLAEIMRAQFKNLSSDQRDGIVQVRGELEQIRSHLARFIDQEIRERVRDDQIDSQLAGINERLRERSKVDRVLCHGKMVTAEELSRKFTAMEQAKGEEIATLRSEVDRLRSELEASRATAAVLEGMANDPLDHHRMPHPRKSWRTTVAENVTAVTID
jgi:hypothetical protein